MPIIIAAPRRTSASVAPSMQWTLHTADGSDWVMSSTGFPRLQRGAQGLDAAPVQTFDAQLPDTGGVWLGSRVASREVLLPIVVSASSEDEWVDLRRALVGAFTTPGEHRLTVTKSDGTYRELFCRYVGGLESPVQGEQGVSWFAQYGIQLRAYDPHWYGVSRSLSWQEADSGVDFFPGPPFEMEPGNVFGSVSIDNGGAVQLWPTWRVDGPITSATFTGSGGDVWKFNDTLSAGEWVTVYTDPRVPLSQRVLDDEGTNRWGDIYGSADPFAVFWPLEVGVNDVTVAAAGTTSATRITCTYRIAWPTW